MDLAWNYSGYVRHTMDRETVLGFAYAASAAAAVTLIALWFLV
jgi:hypothetical protein